MLAARIAWCLLLACAVIHAAADLPTQARPPLFSYAWRMGSLGSAADAAQAGVYTTAAAEHLCTGLPLCRGFAYIGNNRSTAAQLTVFKTATTQGNRSDGRWSTWIKTGLETLPALVVPVGMSGLNLSLRVETFTVQALTVASDPWGKNFSFTRALDARSALPFGMHLGDITLRLRRRADDDGDERLETSGNDENDDASSGDESDDGGCPRTMVDERLERRLRKRRMGMVLPPPPTVPLARRPDNIKPRSSFNLLPKGRKRR